MSVKSTAHALAEGAEALQLQPERPHGAPSRRRRAARRTAPGPRSSSTPSPARYSSNSSCGLRPWWSSLAAAAVARPGASMRTSTTPGPSSWRTSSASPARRGPRTTTRSHGSPSMVELGELVERAVDGAQRAARRQANRPDVGGHARLERDDVDLLGLLALAEVELQRRAAVVQRRAGRDALRPVQVAEGAVADRGGERRGGDGVLVDEVGRSLAAAGDGAEHEGVGGEDVRPCPGGSRAHRASISRRSRSL